MVGAATFGTNTAGATEISMADMISTSWTQAWAGLPDSASVAGPTVAAGTLVDSTGATIAGITVLLSGEPSSQVLMSLKNGDTVPTTVVSRATTDAAGDFMPKVPAGADLTAVTSARDGSINFDVNAAAVSGAAPTFVPTRAILASASSRFAAATAGRGSVSVAGRTAVLDTPHSADLHLRLRTLGTSVSKTAMPAYRPPVRCSTVQEKDLGPGVVVVGATSNPRPSQTSTLGVGVSASRDGSSWSAGGTHNQATNGTETYANNHGAPNNNYETYFHAKQYFYSCYPTYSSYGLNYHYIRATDSDGGVWTGDRAAIAAGKCVPPQANSRFSLNSTAATPFSTEFTIAAIISLSAATGYSSDSTVLHGFESEARPACGVDSYPGNTSPGPGLVATH